MGSEIPGSAQKLRAQIKLEPIQLNQLTTESTGSPFNQLC